jgi:hypothetical protein
MKGLLFRIGCFILIIIALVYALIFPSLTPEAEEQTRVLRLWHIDSFEGGKGSRMSFLKKAARAFEKREGNVYIMVNTYTREGVAEALQRGENADMVSFSCGLDGIAEKCVELPYSFAGGEIGGKTYAYPWCAGQYYYFSKENDFSSLSAEGLLLSKGGENVPAAAAVLSGMAGGEIEAEDSTSAYVDFLNGKYPYMLGTQRDVCRFASRKAEVYTMPVEEYSDLYQYLAVTAQEKEEISLCLSFLNYLLSDEVQAELPSIGMYSAGEVTVETTLSAFVDSIGVETFRETAEGALASGEMKILKSCLKSLN